MNNKYFPCLVLSSFLFSACNRYYYKPTGINDPLFTKGGQLHAAFAGTSEDDNNDHSYFTDLQLGYSPINHLGILGSYSTYAYRPYDKNTAAANAYILEAAAGAYKAIGSEKRKMVVDIYAGGGGGKLNSDIDMQLRKLFIQPGIGMRSRIVDVMFNLRLSNIKYSGLDPKGHDYDYMIDHHLIDTVSNQQIDKGTYTFYEPGVTVRTGYKFVKAQIQTAFAVPVSIVSWHYSGLRFTIGLHLNLEDALDFARAKSQRPGKNEDSD